MNIKDDLEGLGFQSVLWDWKSWRTRGKSKIAFHLTAVVALCWTEGRKGVGREEGSLKHCLQWGLLSPSLLLNIISRAFRDSYVPGKTRTFHSRGYSLHLLETRGNTHNYVFAWSKDSLAQFKKNNNKGQIFCRTSNILPRTRQNKSK